MTKLATSHLLAGIRDIPDFPKPGIIFKDITPLLEDPKLFRDTIKAMATQIERHAPNKIVAVESRGFIFGSALAYELGAGLVVVRKPNKLPFKTESLEYELEYGTDKLEIHIDSVSPSDKVVIVDDILATGGTAEATAKLVEKVGAQVAGLAFFAELGFLNGRNRLGNWDTYALVTL
jgi:adenine phosphoribosyltransferase